MKFVILSTGIIPGFNVRGPVLSPAEYDIHLVLQWLNGKIDVREVMEDGTYRKLKYNDPKLIELLNEKCNKKMKKREEMKNSRIEFNIQPKGNVKLAPEPKKVKKNNLKQQKPIVEEKPKKVEEPKEVEQVNEFMIDELEKPE